MYRTPDRDRAVEVFVQARDRCRAAADGSRT
jgi:hypothetical protein